MEKSGQKASLKISQEVIETIARVAALEIDGVASIEEITAWNKKPINIKMSDGIAEISMFLVLKFGAKISETCTAVQKNVKDNVQTMTGIMVSKVNITVEGIDLPKNGSKKIENTEEAKEIVVEDKEEK